MSDNHHDFDAFLRQSLHNQSPYIADEGFSEAVVAKLPKRRVMPWANAIAAFLIAVIVVSLVPWMAVITTVSAAAINLNLSTLLVVGGGLTCATFVGCTLWMARELNWI